MCGPYDAHEHIGHGGVPGSPGVLPGALRSAEGLPGSPGEHSELPRIRLPDTFRSENKWHSGIKACPPSLYSETAAWKDEKEICISLAVTRYCLLPPSRPRGEICDWKRSFCVCKLKSRTEEVS